MGGHSRGQRPDIRRHKMGGQLSEAQMGATIPTLDLMVWNPPLPLNGFIERDPPGSAESIHAYLP